MILVGLLWNPLSGVGCSDLEFHRRPRCQIAASIDILPLVTCDFLNSYGGKLRDAKHTVDCLFVLLPQ